MLEGEGQSDVKMADHEDSHLDISVMQVQVMRSMFALLILAVTILVIFSSVALLRNPRNRPIVTVFIDKKLGISHDDQSARLRRGLEAQNKKQKILAPVGRDLLSDVKLAGPKENGEKEHRNTLKHGSKLRRNMTGSVNASKSEVLKGKHRPQKLNSHSESRYHGGHYNKTAPRNQTQHRNNMQNYKHGDIPNSKLNYLKKTNATKSRSGHIQNDTKFNS